MLLLGNCLEQLRTLDDNSIDSIVTDPPYGLSFMGKQWDYDVPTIEIWKEALRVLKPGGHLLAFGGTRTYHRLVVAIEDAGFEIRDQIMWIYGSGFPKSQNIALAIDKQLGVESEQGEPNPAYRAKQLEHDAQWETAMRPEFKGKATSPEAKQWDGWGTALKPANEPICLARKPLSEKTVAKNVLKHGVGGLNIDASRCGLEGFGEGGGSKVGSGKGIAENASGIATNAKVMPANPMGRFPANILFDEAAAAVLDEQTENVCHSAGKARPKQLHKGDFGIGEHGSRERMADHRFDDGDATGASRFFYVAKASKKERGEGNIHPTVKPIKLMEYLVKLVTPEGGTVLDPFMGSGTTGVAAKNLGFAFTGVELDAVYFEIAKGRIEK